jgi:acetyl esterase
VIAGDSVGGNMAAVVSIMATQRGGPKFLAQALFYPVTDAELTMSHTNSSQKGSTCAKT